MELSKLVRLYREEIFFLLVYVGGDNLLRPMGYAEVFTVDRESYRMREFVGIRNFMEVRKSIC